jgi:probable F420-dependent oxidoreductase
MKFGLAIFSSEHMQTPAELGRMAEERGFESLFFPEHTHIPASRETPYPAGGDLPNAYRETLDPLIALAAAAAVTERILLGTAIALVNQRDPIITAKEIATLDHVSDGRFLFGVGAGWNREEMGNHGVDPSTRFALMRERVEAIKAIWTQAEASYSGRDVSFERIWSWPKPLQKPHPPLLVAGNGERVLGRVVAYGDEWMPNRIGSDEGMIARCRELTELAARAGRDPIPITLAGTMREPARIERLAEAGVTRGLFWLMGGGPEEIEAGMDRYAAAATEFAGAGG